MCHVSIPVKACSRATVRGTLTRSSWLQTATVFAAPPGLDGSLAHVLEVVLDVVFALHDRHLDDVHALNVRGADGRGLGGQRGDARVDVPSFPAG